MTNFDATIASFYGAAAGQGTWPHALGRLVCDVGAQRGQMVGLNAANGAITFSYVSDNAKDETGLEHLRGSQALDPCIQCLITHGIGDWQYNQGKDSAERREDLRHCYLRNSGNGGHSAGVRLFADESEVVLMVATTCRRALGFNDAQRAYLRQIAPHLTKSVALFRRGTHVDEGSAAEVGLIERIRKPVFLMDSTRRINAANSLGLALLADGRILTEREGRLLAPRAKDEQAISEALLQLTANTGKLHHSTRCVFRLQGNEARAFAASLVVFNQESSLHELGKRPQLMFTLHGAPSALEPDPLLWQAIFDLTPAEARMAGEIFKGATIRAASESLGITCHTANSHLDHIFIKTNTHRQSELMKALVLAMV